MAKPKLEEVFKQGGVPSYTFVEAKEYTGLMLSIRTPGRGVVVEGPSGIGKTSAIKTALSRLGMSQATTLSGRNSEDVKLISQLPSISDAGVVVIDDFHKLSEDTKASIADYMKTLADNEIQETKIIIIGINMAGQSLVDFAPDLNNRIDVIKFETNANSKVAELLTKGEVALNVTINVKDEIIAESQGSFYIASLLAYDVCLRSGIHETQNDTYEIEVSFELVKAEVWKRLARTFESRCERFCRGNGHNPGGRAPYLHVLRWLAQEKEWTLYLREAIKRNSSLKGSVLQIVEKDFLRRLIDGDSEISAVLHYNLSNEPLLTVEDPQFMFFIRNISWDTFSKQLGFVDASFPHRYDFALSFAGTDRVMAESLFNALTAREILVFYDKNEQHRIIAEDIEEYLAPIYKSEAQFVVCLLGPDYPNRIWTKIESDAFKGRFMKNAVIPIWFDSAPPGIFDASKKVGGLSFSYKADLGEQTNAFAETLAKKLFDSRQR